MKAFEVKIAILGGSKNETKTKFVQANSKKEVESAEYGVLKVWERVDMIPEECPMEIVDGVICEKENFNFKY